MAKLNAFFLSSAASRLFLSLADQSASQVVQHCNIHRKNTTKKAVYAKYSTMNVQEKDQFPWKLHRLLSDVEESNQEHIVSWLPCGVSCFTNIFFNRWYRLGGSL